MLIEGVKLMLSGMLVVFAFLLLLMFLISLISKIAGVEWDGDPSSGSVSRLQAPRKDQEDAVTAAIAAAVAAFRSRRR